MKSLSRAQAKFFSLIVSAFLALSVVRHLHDGVAPTDGRVLRAYGQLIEDSHGVGGWLRPRAQQPSLIPRTIHQTYKTSVFTKQEQAILGSWKARNPNWTVKFYDDFDCLAFVQREYPQWLSAYKALPMAVERADFFRYMVILRHGGVYADIDTECGMPLDDFILPDDSFLAGWEDEHGTAEQAIGANFARQRQMEQWVFAASPGHPILQTLCELVASMAFDPISDHRIDALFRTGPAPFTDTVLRHALDQPLRSSSSRYKIRILPRITLGGLPAGSFGLQPWEETNRLVRHLSAGSWKSLDFNRKWVHSELEERRALSLLRAPTRLQSGWRLFPVSTVTEPPFTLMTHLIGQGDKQGGADVAAQVTKWGGPLVPGEYLTHELPSDVFMRAWEAEECAGTVLLDIGAGLGFYSLAAASRGRTAVAFELAPKSIASLQASIDYNGFNDQIVLHKVALGMWNEDICIGANPSLSKPSVETLRGYGATQQLEQSPLGCLLTASRRTPTTLGLVSHDIGAIRISASGWEGWIAGGLKDILIRSSTRVVLLEAYTELLAVSGFKVGLDSLLEQLKTWGFVNMTHMGHICTSIEADSSRLQNPLRSIASFLSKLYAEKLQRRLAVKPNFKWCTYNPQPFYKKLRTLHLADTPELFLLRK